MWSGSNSTSFATAPFKVTNTGDVTANSLTLTGETVIENGNDASIFITTNTDGIGVYNDANTAFYVDGNENFSLGEKLTWDGTTLNISGNVDITGGGALTLIQSAQDTADDAYSEAITKIGPGTLIAEINGAATTIDGDRITTGSLDADRISGGTIRASTSFIAEGSGTFQNADGSFYVDAGGGCSTNNIVSSVGNLALDMANHDCNMIRLGSPITTGYFIVYGNLQYKTASAYSDKRIKNTITPIKSSINFINKLEPVSYYLNHFSHEDTLNSITTDNTGKRKHFGLVAQDVKVALDGSGYPASEYSLWKGSEPGEEDRLQSVSYDEMVPHLVKAIQELSAKVEELESRLNS
jgi:hypothetical protein